MPLQCVFGRLMRAKSLNILLTNPRQGSNMVNKISKRGTLKFPRSGLPYYGQAIGIIMLDAGALTGDFPLKTETFTRIPGDVGNATTFDFPVQYKIVKGVTASDVVNRKPSVKTEQRIVEAAKELEEEGVRAIGTTCGYMVYFQEAMAEAVDIPVFSSSLLQVPWVSRLLDKRKKVGIITFDSRELSEEHLRRAGIDESVPIAIYGLENLPPERSWYNINELDPEKRLEIIEDRLVYAAEQLISKNLNVGAIVLECTNLPPGASAVQEATGLPVFDVVTLLNWAYNAVMRKRFKGFM